MPPNKSIVFAPELDSSHVAMLSPPEAVLNVIREAAEKS
jgi:hypothetical protein